MHFDAVRVHPLKIGAPLDPFVRPERCCHLQAAARISSEANAC
jgi:hypothetical protein